MPYAGTSPNYRGHAVLRRLLTDERADDLVEYVLLGATCALAGLVVFNNFDDVINIVYTNYLNAVQAIWEPQNPQP
jgi:hypothetical protein